MRRATTLATAVVFAVAAPGAAQGTAQPDATEIRLTARLLRMADSRVLDTALVDEALASQMRSVRAQAALAVGQVAGRAALRTLIADRDHLVRTNAVRSLATFGPPERDAVVAAFGDADVNVRVAAAQSVRAVLDSAPASWERLFAADTTLVVRQAIVDGAARNGVALEAVSAWASSAEWRFRAAAVTAQAAATPAARRIDGARTAIGDEDSRVRAAAVGALASLTDSAVAGVDVRAFVTGLLSDRDPFARAAIIGALGQHPRAAEVGRVLQAYGEAFDDDDNEARIAALRYIATAWKQDSSSWSATDRTSLRPLPLTPDALEAAEMKDVGPLAAWRAVAVTVRDLPSYDSVARAIVLPSRAGRGPRARLITERGDITLAFFGADAPLTVRNFLDLARQGYYEGTRFHRVVPNVVAQDGDPRSDGNGGPGYAIRDEFNRRRYDRGALGMALSGPDTGGSQYFLTHAPQPHLDGHYTVFGHIAGGDGVLDRIAQGDRIVDVQVVP